MMKNLLLILFASLLLISQSFNVLSCDCIKCNNYPDCQQEGCCAACKTARWLSGKSYSYCRSCDTIKKYGRSDYRL